MCNDVCVGEGTLMVLGSWYQFVLDIITTVLVFGSFLVATLPSVGMLRLLFWMWVNIDNIFFQLFWKIMLSEPNARSIEKGSGIIWKTGSGVPIVVGIVGD